MQAKKGSAGLSVFPENLLVNATTFKKNHADGQPKSKPHTSAISLAEAKIMASYDSVLMDTQSTILGFDSGSVRSSIAPSSRNGPVDQDNE